MGAETKITATMSELNREPSRIARAAASGPVIITERGRPARVMMTFEEYERLKAAKKAKSKTQSRTLYDLAMSLPDVPDTPEIDALFERRQTVSKPFEFD